MVVSKKVLKYFKDTIGIYHNAISNELCDDLIKINNEYSVAGTSGHMVQKNIKISHDINIKKEVPLYAFKNDAKYWKEEVDLLHQKQKLEKNLKI